MKKIVSILAIALALCSCANSSPTRDDYANVIAKKLYATKYNYTFVNLDLKDDKNCICEFYVWEPSKSYSKWACGGTKSNIKCELVFLHNYE